MRKTDHIEIEGEFIIFRRPSCEVKDFLAVDREGTYRRLEQINPKEFEEWRDLCQKTKT